MNADEIVRAERLKEIAARTEAATPGPWKNSEGEFIITATPMGQMAICRVNKPVAVAWRGDGSGRTYSISEQPNKDFITNAREDIPYLLNLIESLQAELAEITAKPELSMIRGAKTIEAVLVVRGEWQWSEEWKESTPDGSAECQSAGYKCSVCEVDLSDYLSESLGETVFADNSEETPKIAFCPNCGADMRGESEAKE